MVRLSAAPRVSATGVLEIELQTGSAGNTRQYGRQRDGDYQARDDFPGRFRVVGHLSFTIGEVYYRGLIRLLPRHLDRRWERKFCPSRKQRFFGSRAWSVSVSLGERNSSE